MNNKRLDEACASNTFININFIGYVLPHLSWPLPSSRPAIILWGSGPAHSSNIICHKTGCAQYQPFPGCTLCNYTLYMLFFQASRFFSGRLVIHPFSLPPVCRTTYGLWLGWTWWRLGWLYGSFNVGLAHSVSLVWNLLWSPGLSRGSSQEISVGWKCPLCQRVLHRQCLSLNKGFDLFSACFVLVPIMIML